MNKVLRIRTNFFGIFLLSIVLGFIVICSPITDAITRGYTSSDSGLQSGMVVSLAENNSNTSDVERTSKDNIEKIVGVVVNQGDNLLTVSSGAAEVLVESEGVVNAYVSDINGEVKTGDKLVISPLKGVLIRKLSNSVALVIATAAEDITSTENYTYQDSNQSKQTKVSKIKIKLNNLGYSNDIASSDSALSRVGRAIAGKSVSEIRVVIAMILFVIVLIAEAGIIYGAISSAITALGRNPFANKIISRELIKIIAIAIIVLILGLGSVFAILRI